MADDEQAAKGTVPGRTTLQGEKSPSDHRTGQKQAGQNLAKDQTGGLLKEQLNAKRRLKGTNLAVDWIVRIAESFYQNATTRIK